MATIILSQCEPLESSLPRQAMTDEEREALLNELTAEEAAAE